MRIFVTGAIGFVGRWLQSELESHGHTVVPALGPESLDIADTGALVSWFGGGGEADAVIHLAGMAFAPDARTDPAEAFRVNVAGTRAVFEALRTLRISPPVLVVGSAEVYGSPSPELLPLTEAAPLAPAQPYAVSKLGQEAVAIEAAAIHGFKVAVARSFNHTGPGQRPVFVVPAMARRVVAYRSGKAAAIRAGNVDVRRDIGDVRDVVRAYRLLVEGLVAGTVPSPTIVNVSSGQSVAIRSIVEGLCELAGVAPRIDVDPALVRANEAPDIRGDSSLLHSLTGWSPEVPLRQTLADVLEEAAAEELTGTATS